MINFVKHGLSLNLDNQSQCLRLCKMKCFCMFQSYVKMLLTCLRFVGLVAVNVWKQTVCWSWWKKGENTSSWYDVFLAKVSKSVPFLKIQTLLKRVYSTKIFLKVTRCLPDDLIWFDLIWCNLMLSTHT